MIFTRKWAMPNKNTFSIPPIKQFVERYVEKAKVIVDPFARDSDYSDQYSNDLNPYTAAKYHMKAPIFLNELADNGVVADLVLFDPPYSPRQVSECYKEAGLNVTMQDTQNSVMMKQVRAEINRITRRGSMCLTFGWNSCMIGDDWRIKEIMIVVHGGAHNDTICTAQIRVQGDMFDNSAQ